MTSAHERRSDPVGLAAAAYRDRMEILQRAAAAEEPTAAAEGATETPEAEEGRAHG